MNVARKVLTSAIMEVLAGIVLPTELQSEGNESWKQLTKDVDIWTNVNAYDQPYCGLICPENNAQDPQAYGLTVWRLKYYALIYFRVDALPTKEGVYVQDTIDDLLDSIDQAFAAPRKGEPNTLGGIVQDCMIDGTIMVDPGTLDQQCAIVVPVSIITGI